MDIQIDDEWSQVKILNEADLTGMEKHPLPHEGINNEKSVEKILEMMMAVLEHHPFSHKSYRETQTSKRRATGYWYILFPRNGLDEFEW